MIDLFARDAASGYGIAALLETEKIPYRLVTSVVGATAPLVVATRDLAPDELVAVANRRVLVLHGGTRFAREILGATDAVDVERSATLHVCDATHSEEAPEDEVPWSRRAIALARELGKTTLQLPAVPLCATSSLAYADVLATCADGTPAIARRGECFWSAIDLGAAFTTLASDRAVAAQAPRRSSLLRTAARRVAEDMYYAAPKALRRRVQRGWYATLERRLAALGDEASKYPIDASGWLLSELVLSLVRRVAGGLVRVARWPAPYAAAATLTHDVEPRRFAYTRGLGALLDAVGTSGHPATFGLVARPSARWLTPATVSRLQSHAVLCHGLAHRGENVCGREDVRRDVERARSQLERRLGRRVRGYRSPRLDRSSDLLWALDQAGFAYDSSYPDVDRENIAHFGAGVRWNVPYRPPLADDDGGLRPSRCLELPLTAPDCIQPLLGGTLVEHLRTDVAAKAAFLRATGGLYVALVHGGVFGPEDQERRTAHLEFVAGELRRPGMWLASADEIADWWCGREALHVSDDDTTVYVVNRGAHVVVGARLIFDDGERTVGLPPLAPGATFTLARRHTNSAPSARRRAGTASAAHEPATSPVTHDATARSQRSGRTMTLVSSAGRRVVPAA